MARTASAWLQVYVFAHVHALPHASYVWAPRAHVHALPHASYVWAPRAHVHALPHTSHAHLFLSMLWRTIPRGGSPLPRTALTAGVPHTHGTRPQTCARHICTSSNLRCFCFVLILEDWHGSPASFFLYTLHCVAMTRAYRAAINQHFAGIIWCVSWPYGVDVALHGTDTHSSCRHSYLQKRMKERCRNIQMICYSA